MGVTHEYFVADSDEHAIRALDLGPDTGVLGPDPAVALSSLEAILLGVEPSSDEGIALMHRPGYSAVIAANADNTALVTRIADYTTALIADAGGQRLAEAMAPWARTEEYAGYVSETELAEMFALLQPIFERAHRENRSLYAWTCT